MSLTIDQEQTVTKKSLEVIVQNCQLHNLDFFKLDKNVQQAMITQFQAGMTFAKDIFQDVFKDEPVFDTDPDEIPF